MRFTSVTILMVLLPLLMGGCSTSPPLSGKTGSPDLLEFRTYDVRGLLTVMPDQPIAMADVTKGVEQLIDPPAVVRELNGNLIIRATAADHQQILTYLAGRQAQIEFDFQHLRAATSRP